MIKMKIYYYPARQCGKTVKMHEQIKIIMSLQQHLKQPQNVRLLRTYLTLRNQHENVVLSE